ncbi:hypothetical protein Tco_0124570, partial [Tanacetum coccineum]
GSGEVSTASRLFSTVKESVSTAGASMPVSIAGMVQEVNISIPSPVVVKDKGKGIMIDFEDEQTKRTKLQQEQDWLGHEAAVRLQEELDKEERQRMARVHATAQSFTEEEWKNIRAKVEADEELTQRLQAKERNRKNIVPRAVLMKSGLVSINTTRQVNAAHTKTTVNAARPMSYLLKKAHSTVKRPIHKNTAFKNSNFNQRVNNVKDKNVNTVRPKAVVNVVKGNNVNVVKALACWVWKPDNKVLDHVSKHNSASITLKKFDYI